jgi:hypothetical protein
MCLKRVDKEYYEKPKSGYGYKVYMGPGRELYPQFASDEGPYRKRKWLKAHEIVLCATDAHLYKSGFHIFTNKRNARRWLKGSVFAVIHRIKYRGGHTLGHQNGRVIVASEVMILEEIK